MKPELKTCAAIGALIMLGATPASAQDLGGFPIREPGGGVQKPSSPGSGSSGKRAEVVVSQAAGSKVTIRAMDGYSVEAPLEEFTGKGAVVALSRDGTPFGIGNFGPTQIVFPRAEREDLAEMPDDWWVWTIYHIVVE